jgi:hypothetical protein
MRRDPARQKAYDDLEAMERNALPTNWVHTMKFGINDVQYTVTSDGLVLFLVVAAHCSNCLGSRGKERNI